MNKNTRNGANRKELESSKVFFRNLYKCSLDLIGGGIVVAIAGLGFCVLAFLICGLKFLSVDMYLSLAKAFIFLIIFIIKVCKFYFGILFVVFIFSILIYLVYVKRFGGCKK